jgi:hypothetical protein
VPKWTEHHILQGARKGNNKLWSVSDAWRWWWKQIHDSPWIDPLTTTREVLLCLLCSTLWFVLTSLLYLLFNALQACNLVFTLGWHSTKQNATWYKLFMHPLFIECDGVKTTDGVQL